MLEVKVNIVPFGDKKKRRLLDKLVIINTGKHPESPIKGHYLCRYSGGIFEIAEHDREEGFWSLIKKCLDKL